MKWKSEYITCEDQVESFLHRHLQPAEARPITVAIDANEQKFDVNVFSSRQTDILKIEMEFAVAGQMILSNLNACVRGNGTGSLGLKTALGIAKARNCDNIILKGVITWGLSYWPRRGALPYNAELKHEHLDGFREEYAAIMTDDTQREINSLAKLLPHENVKAWRLLSQSDTRLKDGSFLCHRIFDLLDPWKKHVLLPGDPATNAILKKRLGALPAFRPMRGATQKTYAHLLNSLSYA